MMPRSCAYATASATCRTSSAASRARQGTVLDPVRQAAPFDVAHREVGLALVLADLEDRHDARVVELGGRLGLLAEPLDLLVRCQVAGQDHLEGDRAAEALLPRQVDHAHPAAGDLPDHRIIAERPAHHRVGVPGPEGQGTCKLEGARLVRIPPRRGPPGRPCPRPGSTSAQGRIELRGIPRRGAIRGARRPRVGLSLPSLLGARIADVPPRTAAYIDGPSPPGWRHDRPRIPMVLEDPARSVPIRRPTRLVSRPPAPGLADTRRHPRALQRPRPSGPSGVPSGTREFAPDQFMYTGAFASLYRLGCIRIPTPDWQSAEFWAVPGAVARQAGALILRSA